MQMCHVDGKQFRGFAFRNETSKEIALIVDSEVAHTKEFILRSMEVYYAFVGDLISIHKLEWAKKSGFRYLYEVEEKI